MSYTENFVLRACDCDMYGKWKPSAMLEAMQEIAIAHCEVLDLGRSVTDAQGVVWVLSRCRVELSRLPRIGESYAMETYPLPPRHLFFPRAHVIRAADGEILGGAHGLWLLMDIESRKIVKDPYVAGRLPMEDQPAPVKLPGTVKPLGAPQAVTRIVPQFTEFDLNGHVNNTKYADWCWNALGFDGLKGREAAWFEINYDREILPGEEIRAELCRQGEELSFCGHHGDQRCFGMRVGLREG